MSAISGGFSPKLNDVSIACVHYACSCIKAVESCSLSLIFFCANLAFFFLSHTMGLYQPALFFLLRSWALETNELKTAPSKQSSWICHYFVCTLFKSLRHPITILFLWWNIRTKLHKHKSWCGTYKPQTNATFSFRTAYDWHTRSLIVTWVTVLYTHKTHTRCHLSAVNMTSVYSSTCPSCRYLMFTTSYSTYIFIQKAPMAQTHNEMHALYIKNLAQKEIGLSNKKP